LILAGGKTVWAALLWRMCGQIGDESPDIENPQELKQAFTPFSSSLPMIRPFRPRQMMADHYNTPEMAFGGIGD
jgi:hypothetical protein